MFMFQKAHPKEKEKITKFKFSLLFSIQIEYIVKTERSMSRFPCLNGHNTSFCFVFSTSFAARDILVYDLL